jgi:putative hydrolase of the HAD superfamily
VIEAIVSDFGGVLTTPLSTGFLRIQDDVGVPRDAFARAMQAATAEAGVNPLYRLETGEIPEQAFLAALERHLAELLGREVTLHGFGERYLAALDPNDELFAYYRRLHEGGVRFAMLTNNVREWEPRWRAMLPVDELFEVVVDSAFVGLRKPDPAIYRLTCERLGVAPERCVFVDDIEVNCTAAADLGMASVWFRDTDQAIAELRAALGDAQLSQPSRSQR